MVFGGD
jgi:hypothetical protein